MADVKEEAADLWVSPSYLSDLFFLKNLFIFNEEPSIESSNLPVDPTVSSNQTSLNEKDLNRIEYDVQIPVVILANELNNHHWSCKQAENDNYDSK